MPETNNEVSVTQDMADAQNTHNPNVPPQEGGQAEMNPNASRGRGFRNAAHMYRGGQQWRGNYWSGTNRMGYSSSETKMTEFISAIMKAADNFSSESSSRGRGQTHRPWKRQRAGNQLARNMRRLAKKEAEENADKDDAGNKKGDAEEIEEKNPKASTNAQENGDNAMQQG